MSKILVFGDIHGDTKSLESLLNFAGEDEDISHLLFTGDFFGLDKKQDKVPVFEERERQYKVIQRLFKKHLKGKILLTIAGNYDSPISHHFQPHDLHHKLTYIQGRTIYGHQGSHAIPSDIQARLEKEGRTFDWRDFAFQDKEEEFKLLCEVNPDMILSHSPLRKYVNHFLTEKPSPNQKKELLYFGGHTHVYQYFRIAIPNLDKAVFIIRPGALKSTTNKDSGQPLPQTFMILDPANPHSLLLYTLKNKRFSEVTIEPEQETLQEYNASEGKWRMQ